MKILILGARGNLGQQLVKVFSIDNNVIAWDMTDVDITDKNLVDKKINDLKPEVVINAAAYNAVDKCEINDEEYDLAKKINIDGPKFLAEAALNVKAILIHYSTDYVFSGNEEGGYREDDLPNPVNRYGKTKFHGEKKIIELSGNDLKWYLIRTSKLFGPKGESEMTKQSFFDIMLEQSKNKQNLEVVNEELSCFTYTPDLAKATRELVDKNYGYGIYHIINNNACTWYEAALELFKFVGINIKIIPVSSEKFNRSAKRPKYSVLLNTKFPLLRGYGEALRDFINFID
ncbi:MAG: dTDP-4-dehydrorhamnose reductase [Patescibacteria group bacterium]|nr:dTDP-4-dehydrorhamnose reductase [Patescibacteria group bacterium]MBU1870958.1 dTDP-4-dehydrorhamnose reductase [Patescibacteria group bacterium]